MSETKRSTARASVPVSDIDETNFREVAQNAIRKYSDKLAILDALLWGRIVGRYEAALAYHAWWNGYEVVAARSECEARGVMADERTARMLGYDIDSVDGDGWRRLPDDQPILDEDGKPTGENCGEAARTAGKPCHLWSIEP